MSVPEPVMDNRNFDDIVRQSLELARRLCPEWKRDERGKTLIYLFAHLMEIIVIRLNRLPENYFLAFLDYIGITLQPPVPARTLLQFTLSDGTAEDRWIPAGTKTASEETRDREEQVFETQHHLTVTPVRLAAAFTNGTGTEPCIDRTQRIIDCPEGEQKDEAEVFFEMFTGPDSVFYLGLDGALSGDAHGLYFQLQENDGHNRTIQWQYSGKDGWQDLNVQDETRNLSRPGYIRLFGPEDFTERECFGHAAYWLRVRMLTPAESSAPKLRNVYLNTVWAENVETVDDQFRASGDGNANQTIRLNRPPLLPGQQIWITEREMPPKDEYGKIIEEEGPDALAVERDERGVVTEIRVRWHEVENFYTSGPRSRHYTKDAGTGKIFFGDGTAGMNPPPGTDNIRCTKYRTGGGAQGNVNRGVITQMKDCIPNIEAVTNVLSATGGRNAETVGDITEQGPKMLKNRGRAVTVEDYEWLMKEAPGEIGRCKCIPARDYTTTGTVKVVVVPDRNVPKPTPEKQLIQGLEEYLFQRNQVSLNTGETPYARISGPGFIEISVEARVVPKQNRETGPLQKKIVENLDRYLHPLTGGPERRGWPFGRSVPKSEVMQVIQETEDVDYVDDLRLKAPIQIYKLELAEPVPLYFPAGTEVSAADGCIKHCMAEDVEDTSEIIVKGFKQDDRISITSITASGEQENISMHDIHVTDVNDGRLIIKPVVTAKEIPAGSVVQTTEGTVQSVTREIIAGGTEVHYINVKLWEPNDTIHINADKEHGYTYETWIKNADGQNPVRIYLNSDYQLYAGAHKIELFYDKPRGRNQ